MPKIVAKYKLYRRDNGASSSTVNRELYMLSKAFNLAVKEWEWLKDNPVSRVQKERENNEVDRWLTKEEENRLLDIYKISKLLGNKYIKMTQRYAHHCPDSLREGVEILETD